LETSQCFAVPTLAFIFSLVTERNCKLSVFQIGKTEIWKIEEGNCPEVSQPYLLMISAKATKQKAKTKSIYLLKVE